MLSILLPFLLLHLILLLLLLLLLLLAWSQMLMQQIRKPQSLRSGCCGGRAGTVSLKVGPRGWSCSAACTATGCGCTPCATSAKTSGHSRLSCRSGRGRRCSQGSSIRSGERRSTRWRFSGIFKRGWVRGKAASDSLPDGCRDARAQTVQSTSQRVPTTDHHLTRPVFFFGG